MTITRRGFSAAAWTALSYSRVLGANDRIRLGGIGLGGRGRYVLSACARAGNCEIVALCDVYEPRRREAKERLAAPDARDFTDHRQLLERQDIDAVVIGSPDHWHVPMTVDAVRAGKDVYVEKPVTHSLEEGPVLQRVVDESKRIVQTGTQQRSWSHFRQARDLVSQGALGKVTQIQTFWYQDYLSRVSQPASLDVDKLDWTRWLGSAPQRPFTPDRFLRWRWYWDYGGGALTDLFTHWVDVVHWAMGSDTPLRAQALGERYAIPDWDCPDTISASFLYPGFSVTYNGTMVAALEGGGMTFRGTKGMMKLNRERLVVYPEGVEKPESGAYPPPTQEVKSAGDGTVDHARNFLDCVRSRKEPNAPVSVGIAAARAAHHGNAALREDRTVRIEQDRRPASL